MKVDYWEAVNCDRVARQVEQAKKGVRRCDYDGPGAVAVTEQQHTRIHPAAVVRERASAHAAPAYKGRARVYHYPGVPRKAETLAPAQGADKSGITEGQLGVYGPQLFIVDYLV